MPMPLLPGNGFEKYPVPGIGHSIAVDESSSGQPARDELVFRQRPTEIIALSVGTALAQQEIRLRFGFDALGDHRQPQVLGQHDDGADDGFVVGVTADVRHEGSIDFESLNR